MKDVAVDSATVLNHLFRHMAPEQRAVLCSVRGDPSTVEGWAWGGTPWARGEPCGLNTEWNNYVAISSFCASPEDGKFRRRKDQFGATHCVMVDDIGTKLPLSSLPSAELMAPSMVVETSPGNYQVTYFLRQPVFEQERVEDAIRQMIHKLTGGGADPGMAGVTRVLRLPDGINGKLKYMRDGQVWKTRLSYWRPDIVTCWQDISDAFGVVVRGREFREPDDAVTLERKRGFEIILQGLDYLRLVRRRQRGWIDIQCPWIREHTDRTDSGAAVAYPAKANGFIGGFRCHHGHCQHRNWGDLELWVANRVINHGIRSIL